ncbi:MAG: SGNH/GDSL hydrolase family protein [Clostridiales bacterium]|nr:SGNH/GDSL hydrolase family protein [Clostridiales bacterium]
MASIKETLTEKHFTPAQLKGCIRYNGRVTFLKEGVGIDWTGSGFVIKAHCCGDVYVQLAPPAENQAGNYSYVVGVVDGEVLTPEQVLERRVRVDADGEYQLVSGLSEGVHEIELVKLNEPQIGLLDFRGLTLCGDLLEPPAAPSLRMEFIGDSITGGLNNLCRNGDPIPCIQEFEDGYHAYNSITARVLHADVHVVSLAGWGLVVGWGEPREDYAVPRAYDYTSFYRRAAEDARWDFDSWKPDIVVLNLGTNDSGSTDDDQSLLSDETFLEKAQAFLLHLRQVYPDAHIVWALGMMGFGGNERMRRLTEEAVARRHQEGDKKVSFLPLPENREGGNTHPTVEGHEKAAAVLCEGLLLTAR